MNEIKWIDPEKGRPKPQDKIIFNDAVGLFWGYYETTKGGAVRVEGDSRDIIWWEDIDEWIPYPEDFEWVKK